MMQWNEEEKRAIEETLREIVSEADEALEPRENIERILMSRFPDIDAKRIAAELCEGVDEWAENFESARRTRADEWVKQKVRADLEGMTAAQRYKCLAGLIGAVSQANAQGMGVNDAWMRRLAATADTMADDAEVSEATIDQLYDVFCEQLDAGAGLRFDDAAIAQLLDEAEGFPPEAEALGGEAPRAYVALSVFILREQGKILADHRDMSAKELALAVAAGIEREEAMREEAEREDGGGGFETLLDILKLIAIVAAATLACYAIIKVGAFAGAIVFALVQSLVGLGVIGTIIAAIAGGGTIVAIARGGIRVFDEAARLASGLWKAAREKLVALHRRVSAWVKTEAIPRAQHAYARCKAFLSSLYAKFTAARDTSREADEEEFEQDGEWQEA